jgi:cellulose synthase/poly-beta-1,6-N-acetylglucosamine synthase-like glycosyltransferase
MIDELLTFTFIVSIGTFGLWSIIALMPGRRRRASRAAPSLSVVMPAHDEESCIESTVKSVLASEYEGEFDVIVVDDGSTDGTARIVSALQKKDKRVHMLRTDHLGKAMAVNRGVEKSRKQVVVMLDADSRIERDTLTKLVAPFGEPKVGASSGIIRVEMNYNPLVWYQELEYVYSSMWRYIFDKLGCTYVLPGFAAFRREALRSVGGFDTDTLSEDCDVGLKLRKKGWQLAMSGALMYTNVPQSPWGVAKQRMRWGRGTIQVLRKHRDMIMNPKFGLIGLYGLPNNIYFFVQGAIIIPINVYQIINGYLQYFVSYGNYLTADVAKYLFGWLSAVGTIEFIYNDLTGVWPMTPSFHFFLASYVIMQFYTLMAIKRMAGFDLRVILALCFFFPYYLFTVMFFIVPLIFELNPLTRMRGHINVWEKNR